MSALSDAGPDAATIAGMIWLMTAAATFIFIIFVLIVATAVFGSPSMRARMGSQRFVVALGAGVTGAILVALLVWSVASTRELFGLPGRPDLVIDIKAEQWWWRVGYVDASGRRFEEANEIRIPVNADVEFRLRSDDVIHSFWAPNLGGKLDAIPGRINLLRLKASREGVYGGVCAEYCGGAHALMQFDIVAVKRDDFDAWMSSGTGSAPHGARLADTAGAKLFGSAGCSACHTIRGTTAMGTIGPDLSRFGERRWIGAKAARSTTANVAAFVRNSQHIKPNNKMPPFEVISHDDAKVVAEYLLALR